MRKIIASDTVVFRKSWNLEKGREGKGEGKRKEKGKEKRKEKKRKEEMRREEKEKKRMEKKRGKWRLGKTARGGEIKTRREMKVGRRPGRARI